MLSILPFSLLAGHWSSSILFLCFSALQCTMHAVTRRGRVYRSIRSYSVLAVGTIVGVFLLLITFSGRSSVAFVLRPTTIATMPPFSLLVKLKFSAEVHKQTFLKDIAPLCEYVKLHEPTTIAYEVLLSDKDDLHVVILERYQDKDNAFLKIHRNSESFLKFRPKLKALQDAGYVEIDGDSYIDSGLGFGDRIVA